MLSIVTIENAYGTDCALQQRSHDVPLKYSREERHLSQLEGHFRRASVVSEQAHNFR